MTQGSKKGRLALLAVAVAAAVAIVAMPATALAAKATTRIVVASEGYVDNSQYGVYDAWPVTLSARLQRKSSGTYRSYTGTVKLYKWDESSESYVYLTSKKSSAPSFTIYARGKYKLRFSGSSTSNPCSGYSRIYEDIGLSLSEPLISVDQIDPETYMVNVVIGADWNTEADADGAWITCTADTVAEDEYGEILFWDALVKYDRLIWSPRIVEFNYKISSEEYLTKFEAMGECEATGEDEAYILSADEAFANYYPDR